MYRGRSSIRISVALVAAFLSVVGREAGADPPDPLLPLLNRLSAFFHREEIHGITLDSRYALNPSETIRLSVVSQLLAFEDLYAVHPNDSLYADVEARSDFLIEHLGEIRSRTPFDGMLGYALLGAYEITGDSRCLDAGRQIVADVSRFQGFQNTLNWGLMGAMCLAKYYELTGDRDACAKTEEILASLPRYQHSDGSFPHYCPGSTDVHYTAWMGMELIHVRRSVPSPLLDQILERIAGFLETRVGPNGDTRYEDPCSSWPGCHRYYYSRASGCSFDYDTRAWVNELGYTGLVLERLQRPSYGLAMSLLYDLEDHGAFDDKWAYPPPSSDPIYPWATGHPSVIRTSVVFWSLATIYREQRVARHDRVADRRVLPGGALVDPDRTLDSDPREAPSAIDSEPWRNFVWTTVDRLVLEGADPEIECRDTSTPDDRRLAKDPRESRAGQSGEERPGGLAVTESPSGPALRFVLAREARVSLRIYDLAGRYVRELSGEVCRAGAHEVAWDGRGATGAPAASGVYFARLSVDGWHSTARLVLRR